MREPREGRCKRAPDQHEPHYWYDARNDVYSWCDTKPAARSSVQADQEGTLP